MAQSMSIINPEKCSDGSCNYLLLLLFVVTSEFLFVFFKSLWRDHCMHLYSTGGWGGGRKGKALGVWRDFKSLQPWKDFGCLWTFKRTVIYCTEKGMLPQFEQWNMFLLKTIANWGPPFYLWGQSSHSMLLCTK